MKHAHARPLRWRTVAATGAIWLLEGTIGALIGLVFAIAVWR